MSDHLTSRAKEALNLSDSERIAYIQKDRWIGYHKALEVLERMEYLLKFPPRQRMPDLLVTAPSGNGKSKIAKKFVEQHPPYEKDDFSRIIQPVIYIQAPPEPNESRMYSNMLDMLAVPYKPNDRVDKKQQQVIRLFRQLETRMLIIDEVQHFISGSLNKHKLMLNSLKYLANELQIPIVAMGTLEAFRTIQTDPQLASRFREIELPRWKDNADYWQLLTTLEKIIPLKKPSNLPSPDISQKLLQLGEGTIGGIMDVLLMASEQAVLTGKEQITLKILNSLDWQPLSLRRHVR